MHRGPAALVPFCAISASQRLRAAFCEVVQPIVSGRRGDWQEARRLRLCGGTTAGTTAVARADWTSRSRTSSRVPKHAPTLQRWKRPAASAQRAQTQFPDADREVDADLAGHRDRLQGDGAVGTADQDIGAEPGRHRYLAAGA